MDTRAKTVIASFLALLCVLGASVIASTNHAEPNAALNAAVFGVTD